MSGTPLSRQNGIRLGRLPNYKIKQSIDADNHPSAKKLCEEMRFLVLQKATLRINGKSSSNRTIQVSVDILNELCCRLWRLGFRVESVSQITGKHIEAAVRDYWACGVSTKYFASIYTTLNKFQSWIGKPGLIRHRKIYLPEVDELEFKTSQVASKSKSWGQNGIDFEEKIIEADAIDYRFGLMLRMIKAFGLRRCEVLQIKPWLDDKGTAFEIRPGIAKGGRPRNIQIVDQSQREVLDFVKSKINQNEHLGWPARKFKEKNLLQINQSHFMYCLRKLGLTRLGLGVTTHGLRAEYAENMAVHHGWTPATLGGTKNQITRDEETLIRMNVAENLGHSRTSVTSAYYGSATHKIQNSRGAKIATLKLPNSDIADIYANPPPRTQAGGQYPKLTTRERDKTDLLMVVEAFEGCFAKEKAQFRLKVENGAVSVLPFDEIAGVPFDPQVNALIQPYLRTVLSNFGYL